MSLWEHRVPNVPLLRKVMRWARQEAAKPVKKRAWDQSSWRAQSPHNCHTTYCIAGYTIQATGGKWASDDPDSFYYSYVLAEPGDDEDVVEFRYGTGDQGVVPAKYRAARVLGLTRSEGGMFDGDLELWEIEEFAKRIATRGGRPLLTRADKR